MLLHLPTSADRVVRFFFLTRSVCRFCSVLFPRVRLTQNAKGIVVVDKNAAGGQETVDMIKKTGFNNVVFQVRRFQHCMWRQGVFQTNPQAEELISSVLLCSVRNRRLPM